MYRFQHGARQGAMRIEQAVSREFFRRPKPLRSSLQINRAILHLLTV